MLIANTPTSFTLPSAWEEITLSQFLRLVSQSVVSSDIEGKKVKGRFTIQEIVKILVSDPVALDELEGRDEAELIDHLTYLNPSPHFLDLPVPDQIAGVKPPTELGVCSLLQKWMVDEFVEDLTDEEKSVDYISMSVPILSIYLYPLLTNTRLIDAEQLEEVTSRIEALPVIEALPLANFFLSNYRNSTSSGRNIFSTNYPKTPPKNWLARRFRSWKLTRIMAWCRL